MDTNVDLEELRVQVSIATDKVEELLSDFNNALERIVPLLDEFAIYVQNAYAILVDALNAFVVSLRRAYLANRLVEHGFNAKLAFYVARAVPKQFLPSLDEVLYGQHGILLGDVSRYGSAGGESAQPETNGIPGNKEL